MPSELSDFGMSAPWPDNRLSKKKYVIHSYAVEMFQTQGYKVRL
jgi:hypothetical protein